MKIRVKNMVFDRCKSVLADTLEKAGIPLISIRLGELEFPPGYEADFDLIDRILETHGFQRIGEAGAALVEEVKALLVTALHDTLVPLGSLSSFIASRTGRDYSMISKVFSRREGITVEKYWIRLRIEKVKELIQMGQMDFTQIAYALDYSSSSHLARQFKSVTGMSMGSYRKLLDPPRSEWDKIV